MTLAPKTSSLLIERDNSSKECAFCNLEKGNDNIYWIKDLDNGSLYLNYNQSYEGRCLYIPNNHFDSLKEIEGQFFELYNKDILYLCKVLQAAMNADLINVAILGNKVRHVHWHLIPRYENDSNWGESPWPTQERKLNESQLKEIKEKIEKQFLI